MMTNLGGMEGQRYGEMECLLEEKSREGGGKRRPTVRREWVEVVCDFCSSSNVSI